MTTTASLRNSTLSRLSSKRAHCHLLSRDSIIHHLIMRSIMIPCMVIQWIQSLVGAIMYSDESAAPVEHSPFLDTKEPTNDSPAPPYQSHQKSPLARILSTLVLYPVLCLALQICTLPSVHCTSLNQPFTLSLNFKNIHTSTPDLGSNMVFLTSDSNPARIGTINLSNFEQIDQVLLIRNLWIQGCDFCNARNQLFCLARNDVSDQLKMLRITQTAQKNDTSANPSHHYPYDIEAPLHPTLNASLTQFFKHSPSHSSEQHNPQNIHVHTSPSTPLHTVEFATQEEEDGDDMFKDKGENEYDEILLSSFSTPVINAMTQNNDLIFAVYSDTVHPEAQGVYAVNKDSFTVVMNMTFVQMMDSNRAQKFPVCASDLQAFIYQNLLYTMCVPSDDREQSSTVVHVISLKDLSFISSHVVPMRVTGQMIRQGSLQFLSPSTVFFFSEETSRLLPYTLIPFEAKQTVQMEHLNIGITCAVTDTPQEYAYLFTTGPLISILKFSLKSHSVVDSYNLHNAGNVSTCFIGRSGRYLYFSQNLLDTAALIEFSLDSFVPNEILELERLPVSYIINGALTKVSASVSHDGFHLSSGEKKADGSISDGRDYRMYLVTETNPSKIIEVSVLPNGDLLQTNFLNLPDDYDGGIKSQPIFNDELTHAYFARASTPSIVYKVDLRNMQITKSLPLPSHLSTVATAVKWNYDENVGVFATATTPSYVFRVCLRTLTVIAEARVDENRLSLFSVQSEDGRYGFFVTDVLPATVIKVDLTTLSVVEKYTLNSYPTCCISSNNHMWFGLASGKVVRLGQNNLTDIIYSSEKMDGAPLSCVRDSSAHNGFFALEQFAEGTTLVKMDLASESMNQVSSIHLDLKGVFRTAFLDDSERLAYFINYGSRTTIVPVDLSEKPFNFWIIALIILSVFFIIGLVLSLGLYINLKTRWWRRNRAERAIRKKLLEHDSLSNGKNSKKNYGSYDSDSGNWFIDPEDVKLECRISEGAYGLVFRGRWKGAVVAIKKIKIQGMLQSGEDNDHYDSLFLREISTLRKLRHPNIVQFLGVSLLENEQRFIVTEFIPNGDLSRYIKGSVDEPPMLSLSQRVNILQDISKGMLYLHSLSPPLLHRDLKPANVLLDSSFSAKICDFGLSSHNRGQTMTGNLGTAKYISPEVISETRYDQSADVYSFGILCYEVIFLREAYIETNCFKLGIEILKGSRPRITDEMTRGNPILEHLSALMKQCWDPDATMRPSFGSILNSLIKIQQQLNQDEHRGYLQIN